MTFGRVRRAAHAASHFPTGDTAQELVRWREGEAQEYAAQKAAEACDAHAQAFWIEVERAVKELLTEAAPPDAAQH